MKKAVNKSPRGANGIWLLLSGDIQLNPGPVASLSPVQNVQLNTAETTLVRHVNTGCTEPMDFFHMESFADLPRANSDFTSHPDNQSIREHWTQLKQCRCSMFPQKRRNPRTCFICNCCLTHNSPPRIPLLMLPTSVYQQCQNHLAHTNTRPQGENMQ